jgi:hypothetical protein
VLEFSDDRKDALSPHGGQNGGHIPVCDGCVKKFAFSGTKSNFQGSIPNE